MKMSENMPDYAILAAKEQGIGDNLRLQNGVPSQIIMAVRFKTVIDATMCAIIA